ncbi:MAG: PAS domain S-box protein [Terriglobia bacterium]
MKGLKSLEPPAPDATPGSVSRRPRRRLEWGTWSLGVLFVTFCVFRVLGVLGNLLTAILLVLTCGFMVVLLMRLGLFSRFALPFMKRPLDYPTKGVDSDSPFEALLDTAAVGVYRTAPDGRMIMANRALLNMLGCKDLEDLAAGSVDERGDEPRCLRSFSRHLLDLDGSIRNLESAWKRTDGKTVFIRETVRIGRADDGSVLYYDAVAQDISEQKQAEAELVAGGIKFRLLAENAADLIACLTPEGIITYASASSRRLLGYEPEELAGRSICDFLHPDDATALRASCQQEMERPIAVTLSHRVRRKDGSYIWLETATHAVHDELSGKVVEIQTASRDVTDRKRAEEELLLAQFSLDHAADGVFWLDSSGRIVYVNNAACQTLGYSRKELESMALFDIDSNMSPVEWSSRWQMLRGRGTGTFESCHKTKTGGSIPVEATFSFLSHNGSEFAFACVRDISERKRAAKALWISEKRYSDLMMQSHDGVWRVQLEEPVPLGVSAEEAIERFRQHAYVAECNAAFARTLGLAHPSELIGKHSRDVNPLMMPDALGLDRSTTPCRWRNRTFQSEMFDVNGNAKSVLGTAVPVVENGGVVAVWGTLRNVTHIKRVEAERTYLAAAIEQASEGIVITDLTGAVEYVNPAFSLMTGYSPQEILGRNLRILNSGKQDAAFYETMWRLLVAGRVWKGELINRRKDGTLYAEQMTITPVRNRQTQTTHYVAIKEDLTVRKHLEEQFRHAQKLEAVGRLAAGVAHDFNNLLQIITGFCELALDELPPEGSPRDHIQEIKDTTERAASLTRQLLAFSRQQVMAPQVLDLKLLIANLNRMLRRLIGEDIELITIAADKLNRVKADPGQIEQVIVNLVVNARDAMPHGGKLTMELANVDLSDEFTRAHFPMTKGPYVMLAVSDTGCGMDKETLARVFEPFFTTKEKGKGTGLGLATVYGIVKQSGGYIWVRSTVDQGTTFSIYLPPVGATPETGPTTSQKEATRGAETILLAEDGDAVRSLLRQALEARGYKVLVARDGKEALALAERYREPIHLLIADLVMPGMSGQDLAERLATLHRKTKVLYMSGYMDRPLLPERLPGAEPTLLLKPFSAEVLARTVRTLLDRT